MSLEYSEREPLIGPHGQRLLYLRLSLTEHCDFACAYCHPAGASMEYGANCPPPRLSSEAIKNVLMGFRRLAFEKVRLTGGEPTLHPGCLQAVRVAHEVGYESICLTTNAFGIGDLRPWREAGLTQLNVSLNSLRPEVFRRMTRRDGLSKVMAVIDQAVELGMKLKVNTVLMRSMNGDEVESIIDWALARPLTLRFMETMPTRANESVCDDERVLGAEIEPLLRARGLVAEDVSSVSDVGRRGPEVVWKRPGEGHGIGLINPMSQRFCGSCNRLRVTASGELKLCLYGRGRYPLDFSSPEVIEAQVRRWATEKPEKHELESGQHGHVATFRKIGG